MHLNKKVLPQKSDYSKWMEGAMSEQFFQYAQSKIAMLKTAVLSLNITSDYSKYNYPQHCFLLTFKKHKVEYLLCASGSQIFTCRT